MTVCIRCARYIQDHQLPAGGWAIYPGGPTDISASVKAYFALKLVGVIAGRAGDGAGAAGDPRGRRRPRVQQLHAVLPRAAGPDRLRRMPVRSAGAGADPVALDFSLSAMSAWTRTIVVPLSIMSYFKPVRSLPAERGHRRAVPR